MERSAFIAPEGVRLIGPVHVPQGAGVPVEVVLGLLMVLFHEFEGLHENGILPLRTPQDKARDSRSEGGKVYWLLPSCRARIGSFNSNSIYMVSYACSLLITYYLLEEALRYVVNSSTH